MRKSTKLIMYLMVIAIAVFMQVGFANAETSQGQCGDNLYYVLDGSVLELHGSGEMWNYHQSSTAPWYQRREDIKEIIAYGDGNSSMTFGDYAFSGCSYLERVTLRGTGISRYGKAAFYYCYNLSEISFDETTEIIDELAFFYCSKLEDITIPDTVSFLGKGCFTNCAGIKHVILPNGITTIENSTFYFCASLESVVIPESVTKIYNYAFANCYSLDNVTIYNSLKSVESNAFDGCKVLKTVNYRGHVDSWKNISIGIGNAPLTNANIIGMANSPDGHWLEDIVVEPTCTEAGYTVPICTYCGEEFQKKDYIEPAHNLGTWIEKINPTKDCGGAMGHYKCSVCNKYFDAEKFELDSIEIPPLQLLRIEIVKLPLKLTYLKNVEELDLTGGEIVLYFDEDVTDTLNMTECIITGFDNTISGNQTISVNYKQKSTSFDIAITDFYPGDMNKDGRVKAIDAVILLFYYSGWTKYESIDGRPGDVDGNGKINLRDLMILERYLAKWTGYDQLPMSGIE